MRILVSKYWNHFKKTITTEEGKTKTVKDGQKFESLIKTILDLEYGKNRWKKTGKAWDGSRDFEWRTPDYYRWAECKNYASAISLNVISNTLVMAMVDFADEILIFSYSKIKSPVLKKLIQFADVSQKILRIYADESLEEIILKHITQLKNDFFPEYDADALTVALLRPYISCNIISDPVTAYTLNADLGCIPRKPNIINFNSTLCLSVFIFNRSAKQLTFIIDIKWTEGDRCFKILNNKKKQAIRFELKPNTTIVKKIYFQAVIYKPILHLPSISVSCNGFDQEYTFGNVKCSWIGECALQGSTYKKVISDFKSKVLVPKFYKAINFYGTSGIGKSRLLRECENIALGYGYRVIRFSLNNKCSQENVLPKIITEFICALYDIPDMDTYMQSSNSENLSDIYKMILYIKTKPLQQDFLKNTVIPTVTRKLMDTKCYISLDNIQYYSGLFIIFISEIVENLLISNKHCKSRMGFSFNTDYVYCPSECMDFLTFLISNKVDIQNEKIKGFSTDGETRVFINQLLPDKDIDDLYINKIISMSHKNPFYIQSYFKVLEAQSILERRKDCYVISHCKYSEFKEKAGCMPENIRETIEKRWASYLCEHDEDTCIKIFAVLHIFQYLNNELIQLFSLPKPLIDELCKCHFLKHTLDNNVVYYFEHDLTEKFFAEEYFPLCQYAFNEDMPILGLADFWCARISDIIYNQEIDLYNLEQIVRKEIPYKIGLEIYTLLTNHLISQMHSTIDLEQYIQFICNICSNTRELYGTKESISLYRKIVGKVEEDFPEYQASSQWAWIMISYGNLLYESNRYDDATNCIKNLLWYWPESNICDENSTIYCYLYNRLHVYKRAQSRQITSQSLEWLDRSEKMQKSAEAQFLNLIDRGYCKYDCASSKEAIICFWSEACSIYENNNLPSKKMNYYYAKMRVYLFSGELELASITIQNGLRAIEMKEEGTYYFTYFKQRYLICKIALLLLEYKTNSNNEITELFRDVEDINYILKGRIAFSIYWLKSIFYFMTHQYLDSFLCIQAAIETLFENQKLTFQDIYLEQIYANAKYFMAKSLIDSSPIIDLDQLANHNLVLNMKKIIKLSTTERLHYIAKHEATGLLQTLDNKITFPVL